MSLDHTSLRHRLPKYSYVRYEVDPDAARLLPAAPLTMERLLNFSEAIIFARRVHDGQSRESGGEFVSHPISVLNILLSASTELPRNAYITALLHDSLEDGKTSREEIRMMFGTEVEEAVLALSRPKIPSDSHDPINEIQYVRQLRDANRLLPYVLIVKMADRIHNLETAHYLDARRRDILLKHTERYFLPMFLAEESRQMSYIEPYRFLLRMLQESMSRNQESGIRN